MMKNIALPRPASSAIAAFLVLSTPAAFAREAPTITMTCPSRRRPPCTDHPNLLHRRRAGGVGAGHGAADRDACNACSAPSSAFSTCLSRNHSGRRLYGPKRRRPSPDRPRTVARSAAADPTAATPVVAADEATDAARWKSRPLRRYRADHRRDGRCPAGPRRSRGHDR